ISPSVRLAAADNRHWQAAALGKGRVSWRRSRRQKGRNGLDVIFGQKACNDLHAVRRSGGPCAVAPAAELRADVTGAQTQQARYRGLHATEGRAVAAGAGRNAALRIAVDGNRFAAREDVLADGGNGGRREWRAQRGKMFGHLLEVGIGQKIQQIIHRRIFAASVPECDELIVEVACRLSRQPRKIHVAGPLTLRAVTRSAGEYARGHGVRRLWGGLRLERA